MLNQTVIVLCNVKASARPEIWGCRTQHNDQAKTLHKVLYILKSVSYLHRWWCPHSQL